MSDELLDLIGNWTEALGATIGGVASTKQLAGQTTSGLQLGVLGNTVQGLGNVLQAIANRDDNGVELGNWLQAAGNSGNAAAEFQILHNLDEGEDTALLDVVGNSLQSLGSMLASIGRLEEHPKLVYGNIIQSIGAALQGIGGVATMRSEEERGEQLKTIGAWLQSIGTIYQAIGATRQYLS